MINETRRNLLVAGLLSLGSFSSVLWVKLFEDSYPSLTSEVEYELIQIYKEWMKTEFNSPEEVLTGCINLKSADTRRTQISKKIRDDFQSGNIFEIKGLILSHTEAAVFASIGASIYLKRNSR